MLGESSTRSDGPAQHDARLGHGRGDDFRIRGFLGGPLMEEVAVGAPGLQGGLHPRRRYRLVEEAQRGLVGLQFSRHDARPATIQGPWEKPAHWTGQIK
jgi:hypothetical protein